MKKLKNYDTIKHLKGRDVIMSKVLNVSIKDSSKIKEFEKSQDLLAVRRAEKRNAEYENGKREVLSLKEFKDFLNKNVNI